MVNRSGPCNGGVNPINSGHNDGISVDPLEVMFVKVKRPFKEAEWPNVATAIKFSEWSQLLAEQEQRAAAGLGPSDRWLEALAANNIKVRSKLHSRC